MEARAVWRAVQVSRLRLRRSGGLSRATYPTRRTSESKYRSVLPIRWRSTRSVQLAENPRVVALRNFIMGWHVSYLSSEDARGQPEAGPGGASEQDGGQPRQRNSVSVGRAPRSPGRRFSAGSVQRVPKIENVTADPMPDGRLLLQIKDAPFAKPVMARFASDGTLKMLAYLDLAARSRFRRRSSASRSRRTSCILAFYHGLAEECRAAANATQVLVTTHSPFFLDARAPRRGASALARRFRLYALPHH